MALPKECLPQSYRVEAGSISSQPPSITDAIKRLPSELFRPTISPVLSKPESAQYLLEATDMCKEEMSPDGFRKNIKSMTKNFGECEFLGGMQVLVTVPKRKEWKLKLASREKSWLETQEYT